MPNTSIPCSRLAMAGCSFARLNEKNFRMGQRDLLSCARSCLFCICTSFKVSTASVQKLQRASALSLSGPTRVWPRLTQNACVRKPGAHAACLLACRACGNRPWLRSTAIIHSIWFTTRSSSKGHTHTLIGWPRAKQRLRHTVIKFEAFCLSLREDATVLRCACNHGVTAQS